MATRSEAAIQREQGKKLAKAERTASQDLFLRAYRVMGNVRAACLQANISRQTFYNWKEEDADFKSRLEDAEEEAVEYLEAEAWRRAVQGAKKPIIVRGQVQYNDDGTMKTYDEQSDQLIMFLLKARKPARYRERPPEVKVTNNNLNIAEYKERLLDKLRALPEPDVVDAGPLVPQEGNEEESEGTDG